MGAEPARARWSRSFLHASIFAALYGLCIGLAGIPGALWRYGAINPRLTLALILFAIGAAFAGCCTFLALARWGAGLSPSARFAAAIVLLIVLSAGFDAVLFYGDYITYYVEWWPAAFSLHWFFVALATFAGVGYYYLMLGAPMLMPIGLPVLLVAALLLSRREPPPRRLSPGPSPVTTAPQPPNYEGRQE